MKNSGNEAEVSLELKFKKVIESKVRRGNKKLQAVRQPPVAWKRGWKGFRAMGISVLSDTKIDDLTKGGTWITYEAKREE